MTTEIVCSVPKENKLGFYRLHTVWNENNVTINVASKDGAWVGEASETKMKEMSQEVDRPLELYMVESREALTTPDGKPGVVYAVENNCFAWKAVDEESGCRITLGAIPLQPASFVDTIQNMMDVSLDANKVLNKRVSELSTAKANSDENVKIAIQKLTELSKSVKKREDQVFYTFSVLLNTKKKRISELEQKLIKTKVQVAQNSRKRQRGKRKETKEADNPYEEETDDDESDLTVSEPLRKKSPTKITVSDFKTNEEHNTEFPLPCNRRNSQLEIQITQSGGGEKDSDATISDDELLKIPEVPPHIGPSLKKKQLDVETPLEPSNGMKTNDMNSSGVPSAEMEDSNTKLPSSKSPSIIPSEKTNRSVAFIDSLLGEVITTEPNQYVAEKEPKTVASGRSKASAIIDEFF